MNTGDWLLDSFDRIYQQVNDRLNAGGDTISIEGDWLYIGEWHGSFLGLCKTGQPW